MQRIEVFTPFLVACALLGAGCGDDGSRTFDAGPAPADSGPAPADSGPTPADSGPIPADGGSLDAFVPPVSTGHMSYVPAGLTPEAAVRMVILGDSISNGTGASAPAERYYRLLAQNDDATWPADSAHDLESLTGAAPEIIHVARGGARTGDLASQVSAVRSMLTLPAAGHTVVVLTIGGNDLQGAIATGADPTGALLTSALANIRAMVEFFQDTASFPDGADVYLADVYDPSDGEGHIATCFFGLTLTALVAALDVWRDRYTALGTEMGFAVIDMLGHFHGHGFHHDEPMNPYYDAADPSGWFADCVHPNDRGHHELRRLFYETMDPSYVVD